MFKTNGLTKTGKTEEKSKNEQKISIHIRCRVPILLSSPQNYVLEIINTQ